MGHSYFRATKPRLIQTEEPNRDWLYYSKPDACRACGQHSPLGATDECPDCEEILAH